MNIVLEDREGETAEKECVEFAYWYEKSEPFR